jgi:hypothetical protein
MELAVYILSALQGTAGNVGFATGLLVGILLLGLIISLYLGALYYLAERPRITYRQAVGSWWILALSFFVALVWTLI